MTTTRSRSAAVLLRHLLLIGLALATARVSTGRAGELEFIEVDPDATTALREAGSGRPFVAVGVNYFGPDVGWAPKLWHSFDPDAVRRHLEMLHAQGFNTVRVFLTLDSFHRQQGEVHAEGVAKFRALLELCRQLGIRVIPCGPDHWEGVPQWRRGEDPFADERILRADEQWWQAFVTEFKDEPAILAWDLLNEPSVRWDTSAMRAKWNEWLKQRYDSMANVATAYGLPPDQMGEFGELEVPPPNANRNDARLFDYQTFRESIADHWTRRLIAAIRRGDDRRPITIGHIQWSSTVYLPGVQHYSGFQLRANACLTDFTTVHFYPLAVPRPCDGPAGIAHNAAYLEAVLRECGSDKPVMIGEFAWYGGGDIRRDDRIVLPAQSLEDQVAWNVKLLEVSRGRVCGWLHWAFADTPSSLDLTRRSGLWTEDLQLKPWGRAFGEFARDATVRVDPPRPFAAPAGGLDSDRRTALTDPNPRPQFE